MTRGYRGHMAWVVRMTAISLVLWWGLSETVFPQERTTQEEDFYYFQGDRIPVIVRLDQIVVLLREGVGAERVRQYAAGAKLTVLREYQGGLVVVGLPQPLPRADLVKFARGFQQKQSELLRQGGLAVSVARSSTPSMVTDEFIAGFGPDVSRTDIEALNKANGVGIVSPNRYVKNQYLLRVTDASPLDSIKMAQRYDEDPRTEYAYPNFVNVYVDRNTVPNDPLFGNQWHHMNTGQSGGTTDADADTSMAWDITQGAAATVITVLENGGFDVAHPDLTPNLWQNPGETAANGIDDDGNGFVDDVNGWDFGGCLPPSTTGCGDNNPSPVGGEDHGTAVAGVAAARGNNNLGVSGACPNCRMMLLRTGYTNSDWAKSLAFGYAQSEGSRIITNSWGTGGGAVPNTITAINNVTAAGVVVLFAAGNSSVDVCSGASLDPVVSLAGVIAVSSSNNQDRKVVGHARGNCIDILSPTRWSPADPNPGTLGITTTDRSGAAGYNNTNPACIAALVDPADTNYTNCFSGTSSATPLAAGIVGLVLTVNPGLTRIQVQRLVQDTADKIEDSVGAYATATGFSTPASGIATHSWGRVNAYEAVRVAAPVAQGGKGGVDILVRDNRLDWGNTEQPSNMLFEPTRGYIGHWRSEDVKVDAPPYAAAAPTPATFDAFVDETPSAMSGQVNRVYVRVRNRGPVTASAVNVKLHWSQFGTALAALPADFWTAFPNNSADTTQWHPVDCATAPPAPLPSTVCAISNLAYSGASVATTASDAAQVVRFNFPAPGVDATLPNHFCLLAIVTSPQDPVASTSTSSVIVDNITPTDNNVTHRNYQNLPTDTSDDFSERFFVRNPTNATLRAVLRVAGPENLALEAQPFAFNRPFELKPRQEVLVTVRSTAPAPPVGEITITQENLTTPKPSIMGGITYEFRSAQAPAPTPADSRLAAYLVGTWDLRVPRRTVLQLVNPTTRNVRVVVVLLDDNEKPLRCIRGRLSPDDLLEIDVAREKPAARFGVVKVLSLDEREDRPVPGIVGSQRLFVAAGVAETALHAIPGDVSSQELKFLLGACRR